MVKCLQAVSIVGYFVLNYIMILIYFCILNMFSMILWSQLLYRWKSTEFYKLECHGDVTS